MADKKRMFLNIGDTWEFRHAGEPVKVICTEQSRWAPACNSDDGTPCVFSGAGIYCLNGKCSTMECSSDDRCDDKPCVFLETHFK